MVVYVEFLLGIGRSVLEERKCHHSKGVDINSRIAFASSVSFGCSTTQLVQLINILQDRSTNRLRLVDVLTKAIDYGMSFGTPKIA